MPDNATVETSQQQPTGEIARQQETAPAPPAAERRLSVEQLAVFPDNEQRTAWINSLVEAELARLHYAQDRALARDFAASGQFDDLKSMTAEQAISTAMVKIQLGRSWGFNAADCMRYIYFANGRPSVENEIVASKLQQAGYGWDAEWLEEEIQHKGKPAKKCVGCTLWLKRWNNAEQRYVPMLDRKGEPVSVSFTAYDADTAQIWEKGKQIPLSQKWNFQSWARDMYYWRAISRVKKYHAPHVLRGGMPREEALDIIPASAAPPEIQAALPAAEAKAERESLKHKLMAGEVVEPEFQEELPMEEEPQQ